MFKRLQNIWRLGGLTSQEVLEKTTTKSEKVPAEKKLAKIINLDDENDFPTD